MERFAGLRRLLRAPRRPAEQADADVDAEIGFHLEMRARELESRGVDPVEAKARALREFGDVERARVSLRRDVVRQERRARLRRWLDDLAQDARFGARTLRRSPLFAGVAVATLALGIGATTAIFSLLNAVLIRPLPYEAPDRLVMLWETRPPEIARNVVSRGTYFDWREQTKTLEGVAAYMLDFGFALTGDGAPQQVTGSTVAPELFDVLSVRPMLGRTFVEEEGERGRDAVALLSYGFWQSHFGGERDVLGRTMQIDGGAYEVVGVMAPDFTFPSKATQIWLPYATNAEERQARNSHMLHVVGRLADGASVEDARAELQSIADRQRAIWPQFLTGYSADAVPLHADVVREVRPALLVLMGAVALVLLIASVNVANQLLARSLAREREVAVRSALGAARMRLVRQFLAEGAMLAAFGGGLGMALAALALKGIALLDPGDIPLLSETRMDATVFAFAAGVTAVTVLLFALVPALRMSDDGPQGALRDSRGGTGTVRHRGLRSVLLVLEVALSIVLLIGAGLLVRSMAALQAVDPGFGPDNVLTVSLNLPSSSYGSKEKVTGFYASLVERVRALPGVVAASGTSEPPIVGFRMTRDVFADGHVRAEGEREDYQYRAVEPGYFETMRIRVLRGRAFNDGDRAGARNVLIVNESMAKLFWPDGDATERRIRFTEDGPWLDVVGVVADTRNHGLDERDEPAIYAPYGQKDWNWLSWQTLVVRTAGEPMAMARAVEREVWALDRQLPVQRFSTLADLYAESLARRRLNTMLLGAFALLALTLGAVGVYGVIGYTVAQRTREIGIRMALGARGGSVVAGVVGEGVRLAGLGSALGLAGAWAATRLMRGMVFGVSAADPLTFVFVPVVMVIVVLAAAWIPARRAASVEPLSVLRQS